MEALEGGDLWDRKDLFKFGKNYGFHRHLLLPYE